MPVSDRAQPGAGHDDRNVPVEIGAFHRHAELGQSAEHPRAGVAVEIVRAHRHDRDLCLNRGVQIRVEVGTAVMGHLQHVRAQVHPTVQQGLLRLGGRIAQEQDRAAADRGPHDHGGIVRVGLAVDVDDVGGEHGQLDGTGAHHLADRGDLRGDAEWTQRIVEGDPSRRRRLQRPGQRQPHPPAPNHTGDAADVILVKVGLQVDRHPGDPEGSQAPVHGDRIGPAVDHDRTVGADGDDQTVALSDVAGDQNCPANRPVGGE